MKKIFLLILLCVFSLGFSQKKKAKTKTKAVVEKETAIIYTEADAENSSEARVIAGFLKQNPNHPKTDHFKRKLMDIIMATPSPAESKPMMASVGKEKVAPKADVNKSLASNTSLKSAAPARTVNYASVGGTSKKSEPDEHGKKTAALLTHLFNNDISDKEAYVNVKNKSKCNMEMKISGKKNYSLTIPARSENYVMVDKGDYQLSTKVCDSPYTTAKKIDKDIEIALNIGE
ncbi:MAG: hypothetical protein DI622_16895 [Chryseobacterium sp.]|uniref:DUF6759 domain-containing protein n=1 Tax=unclassified Chryseobacterium TaxID=2593645 RepID=UPI000DB2822B|nr:MULTISPECIES: DUF6759 domain-containing protein [unclassified Chryseobacterium]MPS66463.1 hypothetical protein [Chryseobacterium sp.]PZU08486.1 MAG: hypothetical protein DI622_16895 [Chryseobacterium sp.]UMQ39978.1 hypothetical protein MKS83_11185 [Chryseobacterium sp. Y16C]